MNILKWNREGEKKRGEGRELIRAFRAKENRLNGAMNGNERRQSKGPGLTEEKRQFCLETFRADSIVTFCVKTYKKLLL